MSSEPKVTTIELEAKDFKTVTLEQLHGSLFTHEMMLRDDQNKKKGIALKATTGIEEELG